MRVFSVVAGFCGFLIAVGVCASSLWADWPSWRGPNQNGTASDKNLISDWSVDGENLIWRADFMGRSTPVVLNGRVYVIGRVGKDITEQERVACFDAETGDLLWNHQFNLFHTTVPFNRVGWAHPAADPETGNVYVHGVGGMFICYDRDGNILWERSLTEEFGRFSGYGGRTHTPVVDGDLVILSFVNTGWGNQGAPRHRYFAFDKRNGEVVWVSVPGGPPKNTTYSVPVIANINDQRLLIAGNADGFVYAMQVRTGKKVWGFQLSLGDLHSTVVVDGTRVYATHGGENLDTTVMGRVVCIDATGEGDITKTHELWRVDGIEAHYTAPALAEGRLYVIDNSANLHCLDADTGKVYWTYSLGTVGKSSPVWADGKLYATEVNGRLHILEPHENECVSLDMEQITREGGLYAEIYGSPAIAYGRIYFTTEEGLYCIGNKDAPFEATPPVVERVPAPSMPNATPTQIRVVPAEVLAKPGETINFRVQGFDDRGNFVQEIANLTYTPTVPLADVVKLNAGGFAVDARIRVIPELPWSEDFESVELEKYPSHWVGALGKFFVREMDGNKVVVKPPAQRGLNSASVFIGASDMKDYIIQADVMGTKPKRNLPDMGIIASRYTLIMLGNHQRLQILSWASDLRMAKHIDFKWEPNVWYTMKMTVDIENDKAVVKGKVWPKGETEPDAWTITAEDPLPNRQGSPGIYGYSSADIYYDNLKVWAK